MHALAVTLGSHRYLLRPGTNVPRLERRIVAAMRRGAGVVRLPLATGGEVDAVVTPGVPVFVERLPTSRPDAESADEPAVDWPTYEFGQ